MAKFGRTKFGSLSVVYQSVNLIVGLLLWDHYFG
jgi:hypothetical protein